MQVVESPRREPDVLVKVATAAKEPKPGGLGKTVGDVRVEDQRASRHRRGSTIATVSLGPADECRAETLRQAGGAVARWIDTHAVRHAAVETMGIESLGIDGAVPAFAEGLALGIFRFDRHKSNDRRRRTVSVDLIETHNRAPLRAAIKRTAVVAEAVNFVREWAHEPANVVNPVTLARRVTAVARSLALKCSVLDEKRLAKMKAHALLSVGLASPTPPRLIVLEYGGRGGRAKAKPVVLVGKAITFDTGGYSLKDKENIVGMKYDKCGGLTVVGALKAAAELNLRAPVVGIIAAAENMISGRAYRPNDIITTMSGKTVEIISTDAEGRMVLADALTYAQKRYQPKALIDLATLTGGVVVALGSVRAGLFAGNDRLAEALIAAGDRVHERLWRLPLDDDYFELIEGDDSDLKNSGGRWAHPVVGGMFLKQFVDKKVPWAHLDIAGTATCDKDRPYCPKGATGFGVRLLVDYLEHL